MGEGVVYMGLDGVLHRGGAIPPVKKVYLGTGVFPHVNWFKLGLGAIPHVNQHLHAASHVKVDLSFF